MLNVVPFGEAVIKKKTFFNHFPINHWDKPLGRDHSWPCRLHLNKL